MSTYDFREVRVERQIGEGTLSISTGKLAKQAGGAAVVQYGDSVILASVVSANAREGIDFFPLTVDYREKTYAAGKFPGGFLKREGAPRTKEILTSRLIDRPIRPLFPDGYRQEVQVVIATLSADRQNDPDILAMIGASACLMISGIPFRGPIGAIRIGRLEGDIVPLPTHRQLADSDLDLVVAGNDQSVLMIEGFAHEMPEEEMGNAIMHAHQSIIPIIEMQRELCEQLGVTPEPFEAPESPLVPAIRERWYDAIKEAVQIRAKLERGEAIDRVQQEVIAALAPEEGEGEVTEDDVRASFTEVKSGIVREVILNGVRPDGRDLTTVRPLYCEVSTLPRTHGSAVFARGETQALVSTTLGTSSDAQRVDGIIEEYTKRFMLDYNMPPFSVGEVRPIRGPGRREIGHGALAERCLHPVVPPTDEFPYTIRVVSDILESNGSSSMASVCGGTLSLMDAGVPIKHPVAGVSIGLVKEEDGRYVLLTDIIGDEDHYGDMDFKIAGTQNGITGIQLDLKIDGISEEIVRNTLVQAKDARMHILRSMLECLPQPRETMSVHAPRLIQMRINPDKIGLLIGPGGKTIRRLEEETGCTLEIEEDGTVTVSSIDAESAEKAAEQVSLLTEDVQVGKIYEGRVTSVKDFGAFIEILPGKDGLCHISELSDGYVNQVSDVCKVGDRMEVKVILIDDQDRVKLSRRAVLLGDEAGDSDGSRSHSPEEGRGGHRGPRGGRREARRASGRD